MAQPDGTRSYEAWEFRRPWAYPNKSRLVISGAPPQLPTTPTERRDASQPPPIPEPAGGFPGLIPGPYPAGTTPDMVFFRSSNVDPEVRRAYEGSPNPAATDELNAEHLFGRLPHSPLGDPVPFSAYLIGRLANPTGYTAQFNLDSDRAYAYLTWDWVRGAGTDTSETGKPYHKPLAAPANAKDWKQDAEPMQLKYIDGRQQPPGNPR